jgi:hypothetical protein
MTWGMPSRPIPGYHAQSIHQTIDLNNSLNREAQANIDAKEPKHSIWNDDPVETAMSKLSVTDSKRPLDRKLSVNGSPKEQNSDAPLPSNGDAARPKPSKLSSFRKSIGIKTSDERVIAKAEKSSKEGNSLRTDILAEENGRWPDDQWRYIVAVYQEKVGMSKKIADLRARSPVSEKCSPACVQHSLAHCTT